MALMFEQREQPAWSAAVGAGSESSRMANFHPEKTHLADMPRKSFFEMLELMYF